MNRFTPVITYTLVSQGTFSKNNLEIQCDGRPILNVTTTNQMFQGTKITIQDSANGQIVAAAKPKSSKCQVFLGDPSATAEAHGDWIEVRKEGTFTYNNFQLRIDGTDFTWKRTHDSQLGAGTFSKRDFKLARTAHPNEVLAVYIKDSGMFNGVEAKLEFAEKLDPNVELLVLAAIFGIQEGIKKRARSGAAAGGAGGGGGA